MSERSVRPAKKREEAANERRAMIMEAAMHCFLENGYHQTGVRDIAKRAGVSLGNLYNHFPGKHDVLAEIAALERADMAPFLDLLADTSSASEVLGRFVTAYATYLAAPENVMLGIEVSSEAVRKPDIGELFLANRNELASALAAVIQRGATEGDFRANVDAAEASQFIIELIDASAYRSVLSEIAIEKTLAGLEDFIFAALRRS